jgi:hypothetical protein
MQIHHIVPEAEGGSGEYFNGIPVCLDCHAEIESKSNMGRSFSAEELRLHRDQWFATVKENPEVLIRAAQTQTEAGPLQALLAELDFNRIAVVHNIQESCPPLSSRSFTEYWRPTPSPLSVLLFANRFRTSTCLSVG